jgi:hypothetical protein
MPGLSKTAPLRPQTAAVFEDPEFTPGGPGIEAPEERHAEAWEPQPLMDEQRRNNLAVIRPPSRPRVVLGPVRRADLVFEVSSCWRPEALAAVPCSLQQTLAVATGVEPVPPDRQSGILPLDSATTFNIP